MTAPSHVTITNPYCWPYVRRGSEALIHGLASWLGHAGVRTEVAAGGPMTGSHMVEDVRYLTVEARDLRRLGGGLDPEVTIIPALARVLRRLRPELVNAFLYPDAVAARLARRPYVVTYGGIALRSSFRNHRLKWRLFLAASAGARAIVCPSAAVASHLRDEYGIVATIIPNGLHVERFAVRPPRRPGFILCAATPDDVRKRPEVLVDALRILVERGVDAELAFAGCASEGTRARLRARLPDQHQGRVAFIGQVADEELALLYAEAAVTCLASLHEAFGMVVVESLAAGTPVVGTDHGAIPELLTPHVGATFPPDDSAACAAALATYLEAAEDSSLREACRERARDFDWSAIGPQYLDLYARVS